MDGIEEKLSAILADPNSMEQIMNIARTLGTASTQQAADDNAVSQSAPHAESAPALDASALKTITSMMQDGGKISDRQLALLNALRPFLNPTRRSSVDRAIRIARLSGIAEAALRNGGLHIGKGSRDV